MTPVEFWELCKKHDWFWRFVDNSREYFEGGRKDREIRDIAWNRFHFEGKPDFLDIVRAFQAAHDVSIPKDMRPPVPARPLESGTDNS